MTQMMFCTRCGHRGRPECADKGSGLIELILWLAMILPGLIYSIWRRSGRVDVCALCGHAALIPVDSPRARRMSAADTNAPAPAVVPPEPRRSPSTRAQGVGLMLGRFVRRVSGRRAPPPRSQG